MLKGIEICSWLYRDVFYMLLKPFFLQSNREHCPNAIIKDWDQEAVHLNNYVFVCGIQNSAFLKKEGPSVFSVEHCPNYTTTSTGLFPHWILVSSFPQNNDTHFIYTHTMKIQKYIFIVKTKLPEICFYKRNYWCSQEN